MDRQKRILVVDDEPDLTKLIGFQFRAKGFDVQTADDGLQALQMVHAFKPDLIILDFVMPDIDGGSLLNLLKAEEATKNTPVIFLTAIASKEDSEENVICGHYILAKPVPYDKLVQSIEEKLAAGS